MPKFIFFYLLFALLYCEAGKGQNRASSIVVNNDPKSCCQTIGVKENDKTITHIKSLGSFAAELNWGDKNLTIKENNADTLFYDKASASWKFIYKIDDKIVAEVASGYDTTSSKGLQWNLSIKNPLSEQMTIKSLCVPIDFNDEYVYHPSDLYYLFESQVIYQNWINGHSSYIMSMLPTGRGKFLLITPADDTSIDYYERDAKYYLVKSEADEKWNREVTEKVVAPQSELTFSLSMTTVNSYAEAQQAFVDNGKIAIEVAPSLTVQKDKDVYVAIRSNEEYSIAKGENYRYKYSRTTADWNIYKFTFSAFGEQQVLVNYDNDKRCVLDFFVTEPVEDLIKKRVRHIVEYQQVNDPAVWYDAMYGQWEMNNEKLMTPDNNNTYHRYIVSGADDPSLSKSTMIALKNVIYPDVEEIRSVERYIKTFLWGGLQRTDKESPLPFGIYGSDSWYENRNSNLGYGVGGIKSERMWRSFDYSHVFKLYYCMYKIAKLYPELIEYADAAEYLRRAYGTAMAFYNVPYSIKMSSKYWAFSGWCDWAYKLGVFHERVLIDIIDALEAEGCAKEAATLRGEWEKKVKYFVYDTPYPYGSEMSIDATAFESTYAVAKYGLTHDIKPDSALWVDKNSGRVYSHKSVKKSDFAEFMERQLYANLASRGVLQKSYYNYGSDMRGGGSMHYQLSYMSQLGGAPILDYGLHFAKEPDEYLRWGYASLQSSWALINTGYWYPGEKNVGGAGWAFEPCINASMWCTNKIRVSHEIWNLDGEIDCGFIGAIDAASTVIYDSPIFGTIALGGDLATKRSQYEVVPNDGVSQRLYCRDNNSRVDMTIDRDNIAKAIIANDKREFTIYLENVVGNQHSTVVSFKGVENGIWTVKTNSKVEQYTVKDNTLHLSVDVSKAEERIEIKRVG